MKTRQRSLLKVAREARGVHEHVSLVLETIMWNLLTSLGVRLNHAEYAYVDLGLRVLVGTLDGPCIDFYK